MAILFKGIFDASEVLKDFTDKITITAKINFENTPSVPIMNSEQLADLLEACAKGLKGQLSGEQFECDQLTTDWRLK